MPRKAIDYRNTYFYKIVCKDINITGCYVGHTTDFTKRKYQHKTVCNNENIKGHNIYLYQFIRGNGGSIIGKWCPLIPTNAAVPLRQEKWKESM